MEDTLLTSAERTMPRQNFRTNVSLLTVTDARALQAHSEKRSSSALASYVASGGVVYASEAAMYADLDSVPYGHAACKRLRSP